MPAKRHSKDNIVETLKTLAENLGKDTLSKKDVNTNLRGTLSLSSVKDYFGSLGNALEAAGLKKGDAYEHFRNRGDLYSEEDLFRSILDVEREIEREPGYGEYQARGKYSIKPFKKRFGAKWKDVLAYYRKWKTEQKYDMNPKQRFENNSSLPENKNHEAIDINMPKRVTSKERPPLYGEYIDFRGLRHAPINEQGVVFLFGMVCRELGFNIEALQQGFPDCEGKYLYDKKKKLWAKARIEFEFKASNFKEHGHDLKQCDFIVCWEDDWPDCPINVIELKKELLKLPNVVGKLSKQKH